MAENDSINGALKPAESAKTVTLPSGRVAAIRKGKGRDLMHAQRAVGPGNSDAMAIAFALIAELVTLDGRPVVYEDVVEMDLADVLPLVNEVMGANFQLPQPAGSPPSSSSGSQPRS